MFTRRPFRLSVKNLTSPRKQLFERSIDLCACYSRSVERISIRRNEILMGCVVAEKMDRWCCAFSAFRLTERIEHANFRHHARDIIIIIIIIVVVVITEAAVWPTNERTGWINHRGQIKLQTH